MADYDYKLAWAIEDLTRIVDSIAEADSSTINPYLKDLGISIAEEYSRYYDLLYSLCEKAVSLGVVDDIRSEMESDEVSTFTFNDIIEEIEDAIADAKHQEIMYSVEEGDRVRLYNGNIFYVVSIDGNSLWVSNKRGGPEGWYADLADVEEIIEKNNED